MKRVKLLLVAPTFYPVPSGAGLRFYRYLPFFADNHIEVTVITGTPKLAKSASQSEGNSCVHSEDGELVSITQKFGAKIYQYKLPFSGAKKRAKILLSEVIALCADTEKCPNVIHIIAPMPFGAIRELRRLNKTGVKLIYSHTIALEKEGGLFANILQKWKTRVVLGQYESILVQSETLKKNILKFISNANIKVIPNGVDTEKFSPVSGHKEKMLLRRKYALDPKARYISFVGTIHPRKGVDLLIDAWTLLVKQYDDIHLLLMGPKLNPASKDISAFYFDIENKIAKSGLSENVHFLGYMKNVSEYLKLSDIFVFPSRREGMPNAVLEAMSTGLPVILTPFAGISPELGKDKYEFICVEHSSHAIANSIVSLLNSKEEMLALSKQARSWVFQSMKLSTSAKSHYELYQSIVNT